MWKSTPFSRSQHCSDESWSSWSGSRDGTEWPLGWPGWEPSVNNWESLVWFKKTNDTLIFRGNIQGIQSFRRRFSQKKPIHWEDPSDGWPIVRVIFRTYQVGSSSKYYCLVVCPLKNYFASSDPHHDISKQLVDTTFVWSFCHGTFAQLTIPIICFTWQVIVHVSLSNRI